MENLHFFKFLFNNFSQFYPTEVFVEQEKNASLNLFANMNSDQKKMGREPRAEKIELNMRKAVRFARTGKGGLALGREVPSRGGRGRKGRGRRGQ